VYGIDQASTLTKFTAKMRALHVIWISIIVIVIIVVVVAVVVKNLKNNPSTKGASTPKKSFLDWETSSFL
jgi:flagellar basal body-associated protein FliL